MNELSEIFKKCGKCSKEKALPEFTKDSTKKDGKCNYCRVCTRIRGDKYYQENRAKVKTTHKIYREEHKQSIDDYQKNHRDENKKYAKEYYQSHKEYAKVYHHVHRHRSNKLRRIRYKNDISYKINNNMSAGIRQSLKTNKHGISWKNYVDYSIDELIKRLKETLPKGYTWDDYINRADLHIDHIIPKSVFNITTVECTDFKRCWDLKNLQLLPSLENISKSAKLTKHFQPSLEGF